MANKTLRPFARRFIALEKSVRNTPRFIFGAEVTSDNGDGTIAVKLPAVDQEGVKSFSIMPNIRVFGDVPGVGASALLVNQGNGRVFCLGKGGGTSVDNGIAARVDALEAEHFNVLRFGAIKNSVTTLSGVSCTVAFNLFTKAASGISNGDFVSFVIRGDVRGVNTYRGYYVVGVAGSNFQLSLTPGGAPIDVTGLDDTGLTIKFIKSTDLDTNNQAFFDCWSAVTAAKSYFYTPDGDFALSPGIIETTLPDGGITAEQWGAQIYAVDENVDGGVVINIRQTAVDADAKFDRQPIVNGITINAGFCSAATIGMLAAPGLHGYINARFVHFFNTTGPTPVQGDRDGPGGFILGSVGLLFQNTVMASGATGVTEAFTLGPGCRFIECNYGIVYDRNDGHQSVGYQNHQHSVFRDCRVGVLITNGAWLYHTNVRWEHVISDGSSHPGWVDDPPWAKNTVASGSIAGNTLTTTGLTNGDNGAIVLGSWNRNITGSINGITLTSADVNAGDVGSFVSGSGVADGTKVLSVGAGTATLSINNGVLTVRALRVNTVCYNTRITAVNVGAGTATVSIAQTVAATPITRSRRDVVGVALEEGVLVAPSGAADPRPGSRLLGVVQMDFEKNDPGTDPWTTSCAPRHIDLFSSWKSTGWIDNLTASPVLPISTILGISDTGDHTYESPAPFGLWKSLMAFDGDFNTPLDRQGDYKWNAKGNWSRKLQSGTLCKWLAGGIIPGLQPDGSTDDGVRYGRVDFIDWNGENPNRTTVTLEQIVTPKALPLYMDAQPKPGSMQYWIPIPVDLPVDLQLGWKPLATCSYVSASSFDMAGNYTAIMKTGVKIRLKQGGNTKYFYVLSSTLVGGRTVVVVTAGNVNVVANADISAPCFSFENPPDFTTWFTWTPQLLGWITNPGSARYQFKVEGSACTIVLHQGSVGISNASQHTASLPIPAANVPNGVWMAVGKFIDAGNTQVGAAVVNGNTSVVNLQGRLSQSDNTNLGNSSVLGVQVTYQIP